MDGGPSRARGQTVIIGERLPGTPMAMAIRR
jgi:hypothetical protein